MLPVGFCRGSRWAAGVWWGRDPAILLSLGEAGGGTADMGISPVSAAVSRGRWRSCRRGSPISDAIGRARVPPTGPISPYFTRSDAGRRVRPRRPTKDAPPPPPPPPPAGRRTHSLNGHLRAVGLATRAREKFRPVSCRAEIKLMPADG